MRLLVDSDFWYGLIVEDDVHHGRTNKVFKKVQRRGAELLCLKLVIYETATVLSRKIDQKRSLLFLEKFHNLPVMLVDLDQELENKSWEIFKKQTKKGCSFVDCANVATIEKYKLDGILSFDEFYPARLRTNH